MSDLSIKLKTLADASSFQASINKLASEVKPINIKIATGLDKAIPNLEKALGPVSSKILSTKEKLAAMRLEGSLSEKTFNKLGSEVNNVEDKLSKGNISFDKASKKLNDIENSANGVKKGFLGMSQGLADVVKKFTAWYLIAGGVTAVINGMKNVVTTTIELDKAFTSIQMVTQSTDAELQNLKQYYIDLAKEMGVTVDQVVSGADEWLRAGLSVEDTNEALRASIILSSIANMDNADATQYLVAAMNGYNIEAKDLMKVVDKLSAVDVVAATSSQELAEALSVSAKSAQLAGIDLDKYLGMIAVVSETTRQSASTIGNSFKTIFSRLQAVKIGALVDEEGESISDVDRLLKGYGIDLMGTTKDLTDMGALLDYLGSKWDDYTAAQQSEIATTIAGTRQREKFLVLMDEYDRALELEEISLNSTGSAMDKYAIYQKSLTAGIKRLKTAWVDFVNRLQASGIIDEFLEIAETSLTMLADFIQLIGGVKELMWVLIGLATAYEVVLLATSQWETAVKVGVGIVAATAFAISLESKEIEANTTITNDNSDSKKDNTNATKDETGAVVEYTDALEDEKEVQEKLLAIEKARMALAEARNKKVRVFRAGVGFTYESDTSGIQSAQESLTSALADYTGEIPAYANGTISHQGGLAIVGDKNGMQNAEMVNLPTGSGVIDAQRTSNLMSLADNPSKYITTNNNSNQAKTYNFTIQKLEYDGNDYQGFVDQLISVGNQSIPKLN